MQRKLCRLAHGTDEQTDADHGDQHPVGAGEAQAAQLSRLGENFAVIQRTCVSRDQANAEDETKVTDAVDQEGLHVGKNSCRLVEPEADEQVRHQAHSLPTEKQLQQVIAHDQHEHGEREQRDVREEAVVAVILFHIANGVDVHHQRHKGHHDHHHGRQAVHQEADFHLQAANHHPGVDSLVEARTMHRHAVQGQR